MTARWQDLAVCAGDERWTERRRAQQLADCADCPVRFQCLDQALTDEEAICRRAAEESNSHDPASHLSHLVASALPVYGGLPITDRVAILAGRFGTRPTDVRQLPGEYETCGEYSGYQTHVRLGERTCEACKTAQRIYQRDRRARKRAAAAVA